MLAIIRRRRDTLRPPFYDRIIGNASSNFSDIVTIGERIEHEIKSGRIIDNSMESMGVKKCMFNKKKEGEVHNTSYERQKRKPQQLKPNQTPPIQPFPPQFMQYPYIASTSQIPYV